MFKPREEINLYWLAVCRFEWHVSRAETLATILLKCNEVTASYIKNSMCACYEFLCCWSAETVYWFWNRKT